MSIYSIIYISFTLILLIAIGLEIENGSFLTPLKERAFNALANFTILSIVLAILGAAIYAWVCGFVYFKSL